MNLLVKKDSRLHNFFQKESVMEIMFALMALITFLGWTFHNEFGYIVLFSFATVLMAASADTKYGLVAGLFAIFLRSDSFKIEGLPTALIVSGIIYFIVLLFFTLVDGFKLFKWKQAAVFFFLAFMNLLPILWNRLDEFPVTYFLYFNWVLYFLLYIISCNILKTGSLSFLRKVFSYLIMLIFAQCIYSCFKTLAANLHLENFDLGWGICNEAAIMLLLIGPFMMIDLKSEKGVYRIIRILCIIFAVAGIIFTFSRGGYLALAFEIGLISCFLLRKYFKNKIFIIRSIILVTIIAMFSLVYSYEITEFIQVRVFSRGFDSSGRFGLYQDAIYHFTKSARNIIFGSGIATEIRYNRVIVYHSTLFQTLVASGLLGLAGLMVHLFQKYKELWINKKTKDIFFVFVALFATSLYGYIDNTYHMYYYMIALIVIVATIENINYSDSGLAFEPKPINGTARKM